MGNIKTNFLYQLSASSFSVIIPLITFPYITRVFGPEILGAINFIDYTAQLFSIIASVGIPLYGSREIARNKNNKVKIRSIISELISIHIIATLLSVILFSISIYYSNNIIQYKLLIVLAVINLAFNAFSLDWVITGFEDFKFISIRALITRVSSMVLILLFVKSQEDFNIYYFILIAINSMIIISDHLYVIHKKIHISISLNVKKHFPPLLAFFFTSLGLSFYSLIDVFILGVVSGTLAVGIYTTTTKIFKISQNFINDLAYTLMPRMSYLIEINDTKELDRVLDKSLEYAFTISIPMALFFYILAPEIILTIAGNDFYRCIITLRILSVLPIIIGIRTILKLLILIPYKKEKQMLLSILVAVITSISACYILCPIYGENGAAIALIITEINVSLTMLYFVKRFLHIDFALRKISNLIFSSIFFIPITVLVRSVIDVNILVLLTSFLLCSAVYIVLQLHFFNNSIIREMLYYLSNLWKSKTLNNK